MKPFAAHFALCKPRLRRGRRRGGRGSSRGFTAARNIHRQRVRPRSGQPYAELCGFGLPLLPFGASLPTTVANQGSEVPNSHEQLSAQDLLYVSSANGDVYVYTYSGGQLLGKASGLIQPVGECVDTDGNVFVAAYANYSFTSSNIYEFAHGGTEAGPVPWILSAWRRKVHQWPENILAPNRWVSGARLSNWYALGVAPTT